MTNSSLTTPAHLLHLHHVELEPLQVQKKHVGEASDAGSLKSVPLLVALGAQELVVSGENLSCVVSCGRGDYRAC